MINACVYIIMTLNNIIKETNFQEKHSRRQIIRYELSFNIFGIEYRVGVCFSKRKKEVKKKKNLSARRCLNKNKRRNVNGRKCI